MSLQNKQQKWHQNRKKRHTVSLPLLLPENALSWTAQDPASKPCFNTEAVQTPAERTEIIRSNRQPELLSWLFSRQVSFMSTFFIGMMSGAIGSVLLGQTAVLLLQSLEIMAGNNVLMNQLEILIKDCRVLSERAQHLILPINSSDNMNNIFVSLLMAELTACSSFWLLEAGRFIGSTTYNLGITKLGEKEKVEALTLAGSVCMTVITVAGCILGLGLEGSLTFISSYNIKVWVVIGAISLLCAFIASRLLYWGVVYKPADFPIIVFILSLITVLAKSKLALLVSLCHPSILALPGKEKGFLLFPPVSLTLFITDIFNVANQPIITLPSLSSTHNAVVEGLFVGVLIVHILVAVIGMVLFSSWQNGRAFKICGGASALGGAVLGVIQSVVHVLGPGPTIGILVGISGAAGVSLAAAEAVIDQFGVTEGHCLGRLGLTVGAFAGGFVSSCAHSGLSATFIGLCAATIAGGNYFTPKVWNLLMQGTELKSWLCLCLCIIVCSIWTFFTTISFFIGLVEFMVFVVILPIVYLYALMKCLQYSLSHARRLLK